MTDKEIEEKIHGLREEIVDINIQLSRLNHEKRCLMSSVSYYEDMSLNQIEMNFDDCEKDV